MSSHVSDGAPAQVGVQLKQLRKVLRSYGDIDDADEATAEISSKSLKVGDAQFTPQEAMEGLLEELCDDFVAYAQSIVTICFSR